MNVTRQIVITSRGEERARLPQTVEMLLAAAPVAAASEPAELLRAHRFNLRAAPAALGISRTSLYALVEKCPHLRQPAEIGRDEIAASLDRVVDEFCDFENSCPLDNQLDDSGCSMSQKSRPIGSSGAGMVIAQ